MFVLGSQKREESNYIANKQKTARKPDDFTITSTVEQNVYENPDKMKDMGRERFEM